jgi:hypothetical protein
MSSSSIAIVSCHTYFIIRNSQSYNRRFRPITNTKLIDSFINIGLNFITEGLIAPNLVKYFNTHGESSNKYIITQLNYPFMCIISLIQVQTVFNLHDITSKLCTEQLVRRILFYLV